MEVFGVKLCIGRAMARCGSKRGYQILIDYLSGIRGLLARSAHEELTALSRRDFSRDTRAWFRWLEDTTVSPIRYTTHSLTSSCEKVEATTADYRMELADQ